MRISDWSSDVCSSDLNTAEWGISRRLTDHWRPSDHTPYCGCRSEPGEQQWRAGKGREGVSPSCRRSADGKRRAPDCAGVALCRSGREPYSPPLGPGHSIGPPEIGRASCKEKVYT